MNQPTFFSDSHLWIFVSILLLVGDCVPERTGVLEIKNRKRIRGQIPGCVERRFLWIDFSLLWPYFRKQSRSKLGAVRKYQIACDTSRIENRDSE